MKRTLLGNTYVEEYTGYDDLNSNAPEFAKEGLLGVVYKKDGHMWFILSDYETGVLLLLYPKDISPY